MVTKTFAKKFRVLLLLESDQWLEKCLWAQSEEQLEHWIRIGGDMDLFEEEVYDGSFESVTVEEQFEDDAYSLHIIEDFRIKEKDLRLVLTEDDRLLSVDVFAYNWGGEPQELTDDPLAAQDWSIEGPPYNEVQKHWLESQGQGNLFPEN